MKNNPVYRPQFSITKTELIAYYYIITFFGGGLQITIEKVWNAIVEVLFKAIEVATSTIIK